jgi:hypothetical protein
MDNDAEEVMCARIRDTYVRERRRFESRISGVQSNYGVGHMPKWDGTDDDIPGLNRRSNSDKYGRNYKPIWPKILAFAVSNDVDPLVLIRNRFLHTKGPRPPEPTDCMCKSALALCAEDRISAKELNDRLYWFQEVFEKEVESRVHYISKYGWTAQRVVDSVVRDLTLPFNSLYRYYLASAHGVSDVASRHRQSALLEYMRYFRTYSESMWSGLIPAELTQEATLTVS